MSLPASLPASQPMSEPRGDKLHAIVYEGLPGAGQASSAQGGPSGSQGGGPRPDGLTLLSPLADLRPTFDVRTGALTTLERLKLVLGLSVVGQIVREELVPLVRERAGASAVVVNHEDRMPPATLHVNGRCVLPRAEEIIALRPGECLVEQRSGDWIAVACEPAQSARLAKQLRAGDLTGLRATVVDRHVLLGRAWHVRTLRDAALALDLSLLMKREQQIHPHALHAYPGVTLIGDHPLDIAASAQVFPSVVLDASAGPIFISHRAVIRPQALIAGPAFVGEGSTVLDKALIKSGTAIGPTCKVAGEVGGTIIQGFSNKAHDGHLGDSWLGEWVNLGAGTTNSNLLNTYGEVTARPLPDASMERTGETFLGAIVGDHVKTAIGSRLMTGCILHLGGMFAQTSPVAGTTPPFAWATDAGVKRFRLDKFLEVARASMSRRKLTPGDAYVARIAALAEAPIRG